MVSHFIQIVIHQTKQTYLVQLDPLFKLPFAVSIFASQMQCEQFLSQNFDRVLTKLSGQLILGVQKVGRACKYYLGNECELVARSAGVLYYRVGKVQSQQIILPAQMEPESQEQLDKQQPWWASDPERVFAAVGMSPLFKNFTVNE